MTAQRRRIIQERHLLVAERVDDINRRLRFVSQYRMSYVPKGPDTWVILPAERIFRDEGLPILGDKFRFLISEDVSIVPTSTEVEVGELIFVRFCYRLKRTMQVLMKGAINSDLLPMDWEFRYEFDPRGEEHAMPQAGEPSALQNRTGPRLPPFHIHVLEKTTIGDDLHYPLGMPKKPLELLFEVLRLIRDEFIA